MFLWYMPSLIRSIVSALAVALVACTAVVAQYPNWINYTNGRQVSDIAIDGTDVWMATRGGVTLLNTGTGAMEFFTKANSGLPDNDLRCVARDRAGVLWFGTYGKGLAAYDGTTWRTYSRRTSGLPADQITALSAGNDTSLWVGTWGGGVAHLNNDEWAVYDADDGLPSTYITAVCVDSRNRVWIGAHNGGLVVLDGEHRSTYTTDDGLPFATVASIAEDSNGRIWIGTGDAGGAGGGAAVFDGKQWTIYSDATSPLPNNYIGAVAVDNLDRAWFGTADGLAVLDGDEWTVYTAASSGFPAAAVDALAFQGGTVWTGTRGGGAVRLDDGVFTAVNPSNSGLPGNAVADIDTDHDGTLWIAVYRGGLVRYDDTQWTTYDTTSSDLPDNRIFDIVVDRTNAVWCATAGGVARFDGEVWTAYTPDNSSLLFRLATCIAAAPNGDIWVGSYGNGVARFDGSTWTSYTAADGLPSNYITSLAVDSTGDVWIGNITDGGITGYGIVRFRDGTWTQFSNPPAPSIGDIAARDGRLWLGTDAGVFAFDGDIWQEYTVLNSGLPDQSIRAVSLPPDRTVWFGTLTGAVLFDDGVWTVFSTDNSGLPHNFAGRVAIDRDGNRWIATSGGIGVLLADVVSVDNPAQAPGLLPTVFPNPASSIVTLQYSAGDCTAVHISVVDPAGRTVLSSAATSHPGVNTLPIDISPLPDGTYYYRLIIGTSTHGGILAVYR